MHLIFVSLLNICFLYLDMDLAFHGGGLGGVNVDTRRATEEERRTFSVQMAQKRAKALQFAEEFGSSEDIHQIFMELLRRITLMYPKIVRGSSLLPSLPALPSASRLLS